MTSRVVAVVLAVLGVSAGAAGLVFLALSASIAIPPIYMFRGGSTLAAGTYGAVGCAIALRHPRNSIGWLFLTIGACYGLYELSEGYDVYAILVRNGAIPGGVSAAWLGSWVWAPAVVFMPVTLLVFPDGRLPSPQWKPVAWYTALTFAAFVAMAALLPGPLREAPYVRNPISPFPGAMTLGDANRIAAYPFFGAFLLGCAALVQRFRHSTGTLRLQLKWVAYAAAIVAVGGVLQPLFAYGGGLGAPVLVLQLVTLVITVAIPVAAGIAILRYRLFDIDLLINRTLVYGLTTATLGVAFFSGLVLLQAALSPFTSGNELAVAASTLVSFALFQPVRVRMQATVDRHFYRSRYDAARTVDRFTNRLSGEVDLDAVRADLLDAVGDTVQPASASVWLRRDARPDVP